MTDKTVYATYQSNQIEVGRYVHNRLKADCIRIGINPQEGVHYDRITRTVEVLDSRLLEILTAISSKKQCAKLGKTKIIRG